MVMTVRLADATHTLLRVTVPDVPAERVTGVGRIGDQATAAQQRGCTANEPYLRIERMQPEIFGCHRLRCPQRPDAPTAWNSGATRDNIRGPLLRRATRRPEQRLVET